MKKFRLLIGALLIVSAAAAKNGGKAQNGEYSPTVYLIAAQQVDTMYNCDAVRQAALLNRLAMESAKQDYNETHRPGFSQAEKPQFIFTTKKNTFSFAVGGFVALRADYQFNGIVDSHDFIPYEIPIPGNYATRQEMELDATTSRIFLKAISNTRALGRVQIFMDMDFRGGSEGSYIPRLRSAYVSFKGLTLGRDITTFCDLQASPTTIDFQGPNAYNLNFAPLIRYEVSFARKHLTFGAAIEMPKMLATYNTNFAYIPQRVPDFPMYLQYAWGAKRDSHIRASGILRNMYLRDLRTDKNTSLLGWGVQFSGNIKVCRGFELFMNGVYGEGITPYIQDLTGSGLDFTPDPADPTRVQTMPMWGWQAAGQINLSRRLFVSGGYSVVNVEKKHGAFAPDEYKQGQYIFGNIFYALTPRCKVAAEYLYGTRENMNNKKNSANCVNVMIKYNF